MLFDEMNYADIVLFAEAFNRQDNLDYYMKRHKLIRVKDIKNVITFN
jgi:hypothetical protein